MDFSTRFIFLNFPLHSGVVAPVFFLRCESDSIGFRSGMCGGMGVEPWRFGLKFEREKEGCVLNFDFALNLIL